MKRWLNWMLAACCVAGLTGCDAPNEDVTGRAQLAQTAQSEAQVPWGTVHARDGAEEFRAQGPAAVAVALDGSALVLDRLAGRILRVSEDGASAVFAEVPEHVMDIAVGPQGGVVAFSPLKARAWLFDDVGASLGNIAVPRELRELVHVELGPSRMVRVRTGYQELFELGSPSAPLPLSVVLASKKEGALQLADGRGLLVQVSSGQAELVVMNQAVGEARASVASRHALGAATAGRIVGSYGHIVCLRLEDVASSPTLDVARRALCLDAIHGQTVLDVALPAAAELLPIRELAVGAGQLVFIGATDLGLSIKRWTLPRAAAEEVQP
jgi:hypothetical protein